MSVELSIIHRPGRAQGGSGIVLEADVVVGALFCYPEIVNE